MLQSWVNFNCWLEVSQQERVGIARSHLAEWLNDREEVFTDEADSRVRGEFSKIEKM